MNPTEPSSNIALVLFNYFPYGGLQKNFLNIAKGLLAEGHKLTVLTGEWQGEPLDGVELILLPRDGLSNARKNRCFAQALKAHLQSCRYDLVFGFNKLPGLDLYYCADTCFATKAYEQRGGLYRMTPRARLSLAYERAVFNSDATTEILLLSDKEGEAFKHYYHTPEKRFHRVPPGIGKDRIYHEDSKSLGAKLRASLDISDDARVILFIGAYFKTKGLDRLLEAFAALPTELRSKTPVLIVGQDKRLDDYVSRADSMGLATNCHFLGQRSDIPSCLFASDLLVHPARLENTGNVLLEAAVAGLPSICTSVCGYAPYIERNEIGQVLEEPFKVEDLTVALADWLTKDLESPAALSQRFVDKEEVFSRQAFILDVVKNMLQRSAPSKVQA